MPRSRNYVNDSAQWTAYQQRRDEQLGVVNRESLEQLHTAVSRFGEALQELGRNATRGRGKPGPSPGPEAGQV